MCIHKSNYAQILDLFIKLTRVFLSCLEGRHKHHGAQPAKFVLACAAADVHQPESPTFNATASKVMIPTGFEADHVFVKVSAAWEMQFDSGTRRETCLLVKATNTERLCLQCASAIQSACA
jgi:hypothetical protein